MRSPKSLRPIIVTLLALIVITLAIGALWSWTIALAFIIGGSLYAFCCFLTFYNLTTSILNNVPDVRQSAFVAFFSNQRVQQETAHAHSHRSNEPFIPFVFKDNFTSDATLTPEEAERAHALLRQVFGNNDTI